MRTASKRLATTVLIAPLALSVVACSSSKKSTSTTATSAVPGAAVGTGLSSTPGADVTPGDVCTTDKAGGSLAFGAYTAPPGLDPVAPQANLGTTQLAQIYGTLMRYNYSKSAFEPWLAQSLTGNADSTQWTLKLDPNAKFGDGTPVTAADVKASLQRFLDPANAGAFTALVARIKTMDVKDTTTLVFTLAAPWGTFPYLLTQPPGMIVNPTVVKANPKALATSVPAAAAAGPFSVDSYKTTGDLVVKANSSWWKGPVCIQSIDFQPLVDGKTKYDSFRSGQLQGFVTFDSPVIKQAADAKETLAVLGAPTTSTLQLNAKTLPDPRVRQAIAYALDLNLVNTRIYAGVASTSTAFLAPGSPVSAELQGPSFNLDKAKQLLADAKKDGYNGKLEFLVTQAPLQSNLSILETAMLQKAGFEVTRTELQNNDLISKVYVNKAYQMALWGTSADVACPICDVDAFSSASPSNIGFFKDSQLDAALTKLQAAATVDEIKTAAAAVQARITETEPAVYNGHLPYVMVYKNSLHGVRQSAGQVLLFDTAYISK